MIVFRIGDLIAGRESPWAKLYDPSRKTLKPRSLADYVAENANVATKLRDYSTPGSAKSADEIRLGQGAVLRHGLKKIVTYGDENGNLHVVSAVCPHLGCVVRWGALRENMGLSMSRFALDAVDRVVNGSAHFGSIEVRASAL